MTDLTRILESIEQLAYDVLIWILLAPKTLLKIVLDPVWVSSYVNEEMSTKNDTRFDGYLSPVILIILTSLIPFAYAYLTPIPDVAINGPTQAKVNEEVEFYASIDFIAETGRYKYIWTADDNQDQIIRNNQTIDHVIFSWHSPGRKIVTVSVTNDKEESYHREHSINILNPNEISFLERADKGISSSGGDENQDLLKVLQSPAGIIAALSFLSIPLLFTLASESFRGYPLTRSSLKRSYYIQCYFFAPFILALWSFVIGANFLVTPSESYKLFFALIFVGFMFLWLIWCEINVIAKERSTSKLRAFFIVMCCNLLIVSAVYLLLFFSNNPDLFRQLIGWIYMTIIVGLLLTWIVRLNLSLKSYEEIDHKDY